MSSDSETDAELSTESVSDSDNISESISQASANTSDQEDDEIAEQPVPYDTHDDDDDDEADNHPDAHMQRGEGRQNRAMVLRDFFRLIAGPRLNPQETAADNTELVNILKELHVVRTSSVERSLLICPRATFIPQDYVEDAYFDAPIRVEHMEFNISAPHMHATCLEALELQPGDKFLDVGSGCGVVTACGAFLVGKQGKVVGAEIKQQILDFSMACVKKLKDESTVFRNEGCEIQFVLMNAFMPTFPKDYFDKIHVGGTCPEDKLANLIRMLKPDGGRMTVPVGQELRLITRTPDQRITTRVLTQVRFSDLTVPSDADIVLSTMKTEVDEKMVVPIPPSTLQDDTKLVQRISGVSPDEADIMEEETTDVMVSSQKMDITGKVRRSLSCFLGLKNNKEDSKRANDQREDVCLDLVHFAEPDCMLVGQEWTLSSHRAVLKARCEYFRARFDSNMQDACDDELSVPIQFSQDAMSIFLQYIYKDELPEGLDLQMVIDVLHVACYYGVPRLVVLTEHLLAEELKSEHEKDAATAAEFAVKLLSLADSNGLHALQEAILQYIVQHYDEISTTKAYEELSKREVDLILKKCHATHQRFKELLESLSETTEFPKG